MLICRIASAFDLTHTLVRPSDALFPSHSASTGWMILASWNYTAAWVIMSDSLKGIRGHHWYWSHYRYSEWARTRLALCQDALNLAFSPFTPCNEILVLSAKESSTQACFLDLWEDKEGIHIKFISQLSNAKVYKSSCLGVRITTDWCNVSAQAHILLDRSPQLRRSAKKKVTHGQF